MSDLHYLPWLRRGLARSLTTADPGTGPLDPASLTVYVDVDGERAEREVVLTTPDRVTQLGRIARQFPRPGADDVPDDVFPLVEFTAPDLPWLFTPAGPDERGRLRPWLVLVCVEEAACTWTPASGERLARLATTTAQLPDPDEAWAWAHVQSTVPPAQLAQQQPVGAAVARLVCPRNLARDTTYRVALVPLFGPTEDGRLAPRWSAGGPDVDLPAYTSWTFATSGEGGFEQLAKRLAPHADPARLGVREVDVSGPGGTVDATVEYVGALRDIGVTAAGLGRDEIAWKGAVEQLVEQGSTPPVLDLTAPDPVVAPPNVGTWATGRTTLPNGGWQRAVNLIPNRRMAAGLGAEVVRRNQERFMAEAWKQAGEVREAWQAANETRLQAEVARTWKGRTDRLVDADQLTVTRPQLTFARDEDGTVADRLRRSAVPDGLLTEGFVRLARPGAVTAVPRTALATTFVEATAARVDLDEVDPGVLRFAEPTAPVGCIGPNPVRDLAPPQLSAATPVVTEATIQPTLTAIGRADRSARVADVLGRRGRRRAPQRRGALRRTAAPLRSERRGAVAAGPVVERSTAVAVEIAVAVEELTSTGTQVSELDVAAVARVASSTLTPLVEARARLVARVPGLAEVWGDAPDLPVEVRIGPVLDEPLFGSLVELGHELVLPGVDAMPTNRVRMVEGTTPYVAAFLAGANHEMTRELLWREFPGDPGATVFRRFWDRYDRDATDITEMHTWDEVDSLRTLGATAGEPTVLVTRGDVVRRFPTTRILLIDPTGRVIAPSFGALLDDQTRMDGFDADPDEVATVEGWMVAVEEQRVDARFGLDRPEGAPPDLDTWSDLAWPHLAEPTAAHLAVGAGLTAATPDGSEWGRNAASLARATHQRPFRLLLRATDLIGRP